MIHMKQGWTVNGLSVLVAVLATLLAMQYFGGDSRHAFAQSSMGSADYMIGLIGPSRQSKIPLFLIDSKRQTVMVYDYHQDQRELRLRAVRSYRFDRELEDAEFGVKGPSVKDVKSELEKREGR